MKVTHEETFSIEGLSREEMHWLNHEITDLVDDAWVQDATGEGRKKSTPHLKFLLALNGVLMVALSETDGKKL